MSCMKTEVEGRFQRGIVFDPRPWPAAGSRKQPFENIRLERGGLIQGHSPSPFRIPKPRTNEPDSASGKQAPMPIPRVRRIVLRSTMPLREEDVSAAAASPIDMVGMTGRSHRCESGHSRVAGEQTPPFEVRKETSETWNRRVKRNALTIS